MVIFYKSQVASLNTAGALLTQPRNAYNYNVSASHFVRVHYFRTDFERNFLPTYSLRLLFRTEWYHWSWCITRNRSVTSKFYPFKWIASRCNLASYNGGRQSLQKIYRTRSGQFDPWIKLNWNCHIFDIWRFSCKSTFATLTEKYISYFTIWTLFGWLKEEPILKTSHWKKVTKGNQVDITKWCHFYKSWPTAMERGLHLTHLNFHQYAADFKMQYTTSFPLIKSGNFWVSFLNIEKLLGSLDHLRDSNFLGLIIFS